VIFLDWSQYGAPGWTEACPGVDLSDLIGGWSGSKVVGALGALNAIPNQEGGKDIILLVRRIS
jgi:hypothetical protein